jgi:hypothetical protein
MSQLAVVRTAPFPFEIYVPVTEYELSSANIPNFPTGGRIVGWDLQNAATAADQLVRCRLGPSGATITVATQVGGTPVIIGDGVPLYSGRSYSFSRPEDLYETTDSTVWGILILKSYMGGSTTVLVTGVATVLLPPGVTV